MEDLLKSNRFVSFGEFERLLSSGSDRSTSEDISRFEALKKYESYREDLLKRRAPPFVERMRQCAWFRARYEPGARAGCFKDRYNRAVDRFAQWRTQFNAGEFNDLQLHKGADERIAHGERFCTVSDPSYGRLDVDPDTEFDNRLRDMVDILPRCFSCPANQPLLNELVVKVAQCIEELFNGNTFRAIEKREAEAQSVAQSEAQSEAQNSTESKLQDSDGVKLQNLMTSTAKDDVPDPSSARVFFNGTVLLSERLNTQTAEESSLIKTTDRHENEGNETLKPLEAGITGTEGTKAKDMQATETTANPKEHSRTDRDGEEDLDMTERDDEAEEEKETPSASAGLKQRKFLNAVVVYLWDVFQFDFFAVAWNYSKKPGPYFHRYASDVTQTMNDQDEFDLSAFEVKVGLLLEPADTIRPGIGLLSYEEMLHNELSHFMVQEEENKYRCRIGDCSKLFMAPVYIFKHISKRHQQVYADTKELTEILRNYLRDSGRILPPEFKIYTGGASRRGEYSVRSHRGRRFDRYSGSRSARVPRFDPYGRNSGPPHRPPFQRREYRDLDNVQIAAPELDY